MRDFGSILGGPGSFKNQLKIEKIAFGTLSGFQIDLGSDFEAILDDFGAILDRFWMDFRGIWEEFGEDAWSFLEG